MVEGTGFMVVLAFPLHCRMKSLLPAWHGTVVEGPNLYNQVSQRVHDLRPGA